MQKVKLVSFLISLFFLRLAHAGYEPTLDWKTLESPHFYLHFVSAQDALAQQTLIAAEAIHADLVEQLNWQPKAKTHLVLTDHIDQANGYASPFPYNRSVLFVQPPAAGEMDMQDWLKSLITHEYTHVLHLDKADNVPAALRNVFGRLWVLYPNVFQPTWLQEGLATYYETDNVLRQGRGQSTLFKVKMREELRSGFKSVAEVNMASPSWPLDARYLYGYYFHQFVADVYGEEKILQLIENYSRNWFPFLLNSNASSVLNKNMNQLWAEFEAYLRKEFQLEQEPALLPSATYNGFFKQSLVRARDGSVWFSGYDGYEQPGLYQFSQGQVTKVMALNSLAKLDWHPTQGILLTQLEVHQEYNLFFDVYHFDPNSKTLTPITDGARVHDAVWEHGGETFLALKAKDGKFSLERLNKAGKTLRVLYQGNGEVIADIELSPDGQSLLATIQPLGSSRAALHLFDLTTLSWQQLLPTQFHSMHGKFIDDNNIIYSSDQYAERFALYQLNLERAESWRLSRDGGSLFEPTPISPNDHVALQYSAEGFDLVTVTQTPSNPSADAAITQHQFRPVLFSVAVDAAELDSNTPSANNSRTKSGAVEFSIYPYRASQSLSPTFWAPFAIGNDNTVEVGLQTSSMDALENHIYTFSGSIELERQLPNLLLNYQYDRYFALQANHYHDISDDDDPATSDFVEQNSQIKMSLYYPISRLRERWNFELALAFDTTREYLWYQDDLRFIREFNDPLVGIALHYDSSEYFLRAISPNDGRQVKFAIATSDLMDSNFSGSRALLDWREFIQLQREHSLAIRAVLGSAEQGGRNFRLGGDFSEPYFMRGYELVEHRFALRGYPDFSDQLSARHFRLLTTEWRFPIAHVERTWMAPPIGLEKISGNVFYERARMYGHSATVIGRFPLQDLSEQQYSSYGVELLAQLRLFYSLPVDVRFGYVIGDDPVIGQTETYISLGTSF